MISAQYGSTVAQNRLGVSLDFDFSVLTSSSISKTSWFFEDEDFLFPFSFWFAWAWTMPTFSSSFCFLLARSSTKLGLQRFREFRISNSFCLTPFFSFLSHHSAKTLFSVSRRRERRLTAARRVSKSLWSIGRSSTEIPCSVGLSDAVEYEGHIFLWSNDLKS